jgi:hypothetical protein
MIFIWMLPEIILLLDFSITTVISTPASGAETSFPHAPHRLAPSASLRATLLLPVGSLWTKCGGKIVHGFSTGKPHQPASVLNRFW